jgi:hypothetical protein
MNWFQTWRKWTKADLIKDFTSINRKVCEEDLDHNEDRTINYDLKLGV